jgi:hypothetical protein
LSTTENKLCEQNLLANCEILAGAEWELLLALLVHNIFLLYNIKIPDNATDTDRKELFKELKLMAEISEHLNIVKMIGACSKGGKMWIDRLRV